MATFVLVHGAWQGASTWAPLVRILREEGHQVHAPSLTGMGEKAHQLQSSVTLNEHIQDVEQYLRFEQLTNVILVGHSYGGMIVTGVAERAPNAIKHISYIDAFVPLHGENAFDFFPPPVQQMFRNVAQSQGQGWRLPASDMMLDLWALRPGPHRDFVKSKLSDFSIKMFESALEAPNYRAAGFPRSYVACTSPDYQGRHGFRRFLERAQSEGWKTAEFPTGHDCHVEASVELAKFLISLAD